MRLNLNDNKPLSSFFSSSLKNFAAAFGSGAGKKAVFVAAFPFGRLIGPFHS